MQLIWGQGGEGKLEVPGIMVGVGDNKNVLDCPDMGRIRPISG